MDFPARLIFSNLALLLQSMSALLLISISLNLIKASCCPFPVWFIMIEDLKSSLNYNETQLVLGRHVHGSTLEQLLLEFFFLWWILLHMLLYFSFRIEFHARSRYIPLLSYSDHWEQSCFVAKFAAVLNIVFNRSTNFILKFTYR